MGRFEQLQNSEARGQGVDGRLLSPIARRRPRSPRKGLVEGGPRTKGLLETDSGLVFGVSGRSRASVLACGDGRVLAVPTALAFAFWVGTLGLRAGSQRRNGGLPCRRLACAPAHQPRFLVTGLRSVCGSACPAAEGRPSSHTAAARWGQGPPQCEL